MLKLSAANLDDLYVGAIKEVLGRGTKSSPRGMDTLELSPAILTLQPQRYLATISNPGRKLNYAFQAIELCLYLAGRSDPDVLCRYNRKIREFVNPRTGDFDGAYGPRIGRQLAACVSKIKEDANTRQAVLVLRRPYDLWVASKDIPCTTSIQFLLRDGLLNTIVNMRSNDLAWGFPYDAMCFSAIQHAMAKWVGARPGYYHHIAGSLHAYESTKGLLEETVGKLEDEEINGWPGLLEWEADEIETRNALTDFFRIEAESVKDPEGVWKLISALPAPFNRYAKLVCDYNHKRKEAKEGAQSHI